jgi:hypothetical protein
MGEGKPSRRVGGSRLHVRHALTGEDAVDTDFERWRITTDGRQTPF